MLAEGTFCSALLAIAPACTDFYRLGKAYATFFGGRGANVVVNDLGGSVKGGAEGSSKVCT